jgi:TfoX/Sxy family transcriptional regulator of competence genes
MWREKYVMFGEFFVYRHKAFFGQSYTKTAAMKVERDTIAASVASPIIYVVTK